MIAPQLLLICFMCAFGTVCGWAACFLLATSPLCHHFISIQPGCIVVRAL